MTDIPSHHLDFIGVGNISYDLVMHVEQFPTGDGKYPASAPQMLSGGMIANATCAAAQLGLSCGYVGAIGDDYGGKLLQSDFEVFGVDKSGLLIDADESTPFTIIMLNPQGERIILLPASPLYHFELTSQHRNLIQQAKVIYTHPRSLAWCLELADIAKKNNQLFALDVEFTDLTKDELHDVFVETDIVFTTRDIMTEYDLEDLPTIGCRNWFIVTAGSDGAYGIEPNKEASTHVPARQVNVVDTTGAGDCFHAAVIAAYLRGYSLQDALQYATIAASFAVQSIGARGGLPTHDEVNQLMVSDD